MDPLREHDTIIRGSRTGWQGEEFHLRETSFDALSALIERETVGLDPTNLNPVASATRVRGRSALKLTQWVGVIRLSDGTTLEILPKTHERGESAQASRRLLLRMLAVTDERFRIAPPTDLDPARMPLFEVVLSYALASFRAAIRRGVPHAYVPVEEERAGLRGRLNMTRQFRQPPSRAHLLHVRYDEYLPDRPETRLVRSSVERILRLTGLDAIRRLARETLYALDEVPVSRNINADFEQWRLERGNAHFAPLESVARLILFDLNPLAGGKSVESISVLFDMNRVFESYVAWRLRQEQPTWQVRTQVEDEWLGRLEGQEVFKLKPDLVLKPPGGPIIVADTKWKRLNGRREKNHGVSQDDVYQMLAYSVTYQENQATPELWLLYPSVLGLPQTAPEIRLPGERTLRIVPLALDGDTPLRLPPVSS